MAPSPLLQDPGEREAGRQDTCHVLNACQVVRCVQQVQGLC